MPIDPVIAALAAIDSPTVANAIERFGVRPRTAGYADMGLRCQFPARGSMVGYAVTCTADSTTEGRPDGVGLMGLWEAIAASPLPAVVVIKDVGPSPARAATWARSWRPWPVASAPSGASRTAAFAT